MEDKKEEVIAIRKPIKVLHFSDGILEVFDDDDKVPEPIEEISEKVDESELSWAPWFRYKAQRLGRNVLSGLDYTGEALADFLNITKPKYAYEIAQFRKEEARKAREAEELKNNTWKIGTESQDNEPVTKPPT